MDTTQPPFDGRKFREVLGHLPTGVVVVTAISQVGTPVGMAVGSFTSVSLDPPLVAFFPAMSSTSFPAIQNVGSFCVNILSARQEWICRAFAMSGGDKFQGIEWKKSHSGAPIIDGTVAWIDCTLDKVYPAGDHYIALGRVMDLGIGTPTVPLLFFQGGYGGFAAASLAIGASADMLEALRIADRAREEMEAVAAEVDAECHAHVLQGRQIVVVSSAYPPRTTAPPSRLGMRFPIVPPWGEVFMAWSDDQSKAQWLDELRMPAGSAQRQAICSEMQQIREYGWAFTVRTKDADNIDSVLEMIAQHGYTPATERQLAQIIGHVGAHGDPANFDGLPPGTVRTVSAPVFGPSGGPVLVISLRYRLPDRPIADVRKDIERLRRAADHVTNSLL